MRQVIVLTVAAALFGMLSKWARRNRPSAVPELMPAQVKSAAKKVDRSAAKVEAAVSALRATIAAAKAGITPSATVLADRAFQTPVSKSLSAWRS
jgi:hypothetical protein